MDIIYNTEPIKYNLTDNLKNILNILINLIEFNNDHHYEFIKYDKATIYNKDDNITKLQYYLINKHDNGYIGRFNFYLYQERFETMDETIKYLEDMIYPIYENYIKDYEYNDICRSVYKIYEAGEYVIYYETSIHDSHIEQEYIKNNIYKRNRIKSARK